MPAHLKVDYSTANRFLAVKTELDKIKTCILNRGRERPSSLLVIPNERSEGGSPNAAKCPVRYLPAVDMTHLVGGYDKRYASMEGSGKAYSGAEAESDVYLTFVISNERSEERSPDAKETPAYHLNP